MTRPTPQPLPVIPVPIAALPDWNTRIAKWMTRD